MTMAKPATVVQVPLQRVLVVFDDMDVPNGTVRLRAKGGHGGHNGMRSITQHFSGSKEFPRLRLGGSSLVALEHPALMAYVMWARASSESLFTFLVTS